MMAFLHAWTRLKFGVMMVSKVTDQYSTHGNHVHVSNFEIVFVT